ncbi:MAG: heavy-metal-associated domain-containing protein [Acidobacteria bacterium]|nr:heavy-metal-associated domain-containing protein [Acidobacteriota bacterium]
MNHLSLRRYLYVFPIMALLLSLAHPSGALGALPTQRPEAGMLEVTVQVDGLSCPFCAYGLEKKLKKVENVADLSIQVDQGRAVLTPEVGTSLDLEELEKAVRDGGFTPHGITLIARGRLTEFNGVPALELPNDTVLLLSDNAETSALLESGSGAVVRVEGQATLESKDGHTGHPYTLSISAFEID